jgi:hypothetical protein
MTTTTAGLAATFAAMRTLAGEGSGLLETVGPAEGPPDLTSEPVDATPLDRLAAFLGRQP